jgi:hypothetical protein
MMKLDPRTKISVCTGISTAALLFSTGRLGAKKRKKVNALSFGEALVKTLVDVSRVLNRNKIRHLHIGGFAVAYHGFPRATGDIDIITPRDEKTVSRVRKLLTSDFLKPVEFYKDESSFFESRNGEFPTIVEVMHIDSRLFEGFWKRMERMRMKGAVVNMISLNDLILLKKQSHRPKDLIDIDELNRIRSMNEERD